MSVTSFAKATSSPSSNRPVVGALSRGIAERTDLEPGERERLEAIIAEWSMIADLSMSDLVLWVPTWNDGGLLAVALVRPTTAPTSVPEDIVGTYAPRGRYPELDEAIRSGRAHGHAYPISSGHRVIGVVARHTTAQVRVPGRLEEVYAQSAEDLLVMLVDGTFPPVTPDEPTTDAPRVGDGLIRCGADGTVEFASPNAMSALRRLGVQSNIEGRALSALVARLVQRPGPIDESVHGILMGQQAGRADIENQSATVQMRGFPLLREGSREGALVLVHDVTEVRRREQALVSKDATIREVHHRVKNNLQMVAALLRLQSRRSTSEATRMALDEAQMRVAAIAVVHEALSRDTIDAVPFGEVLDRIIAMLAELAPSYAAGGPVPALRREGVPVVLGSEIATTLAMCLSELAHNAIEHAHASLVLIDVSVDDGQIQATVTDDGVGLPEGFDLATAGLGLQIVQTLVSGELGGEFTIGPAPTSGTRALVTVRTAG